MKTQSILIIEDDKELSNGLKLALKDIGADIIQCVNLADSRTFLSRTLPDVILLDINLPDGSGLDFLREIKQSENIPVILLTANDTEMDVVSGLESGADDYITKPFSLAILRARVNAQLRRKKSDLHIFKTENYIFDFKNMEFSKDGEIIELSKTEQKILRLLTENRGATIPRGTFIEKVWSDGMEFVDENALSVAIKRLRDKLDASKYIKTVYGIGYTWEFNK